MDGNAATVARVPGDAGALRSLLGEDAESLARSWGLDAWQGRIAPDRARAFFDWPRLNTVLAEHRFDASRLQLVGGVRTQATDASGRIRQAEVLTALRSGATLILNAASETSAPLRALCDALGAAFTCACQANLYACWGATQGFDVHWDDHDVLVIQVEGRKRWRLYGLTRQSPTIRNDPPDHRPPPEPRQEVTLEPGDILYLPRGYWHAAVGLREPSLHLTVGLTRRTGADFLHWLADHLLSDAGVRRDVPFERGDAAVASQIAALLSTAGAREAMQLAVAYRRHTEAALRGHAMFSFPAIGGGETEPSPHDLVSLAPGPVRLDHGARTSVLTWRGTRYTIAGALRPALARLIAGEAVRVGDLAPTASPERGFEFLREMTARGVFVLRPADAA